MSCYWCYWGWPKPIREIYDDCVKQVGEGAMRYGPAHIVWADENWDCAGWCLDHFDEWARDWNHDHDGNERYSAGQLDVVRESLKRLVAVPDDFKREPVGYDEDDPDADPRDYPPPAEWECEKR